jgi:hypothetical protein
MGFFDFLPGLGGGGDGGGGSPGSASGVGSSASTATDNRQVATDQATIASGSARVVAPGAAEFTTSGNLSITSVPPEVLAFAAQQGQTLSNTLLQLFQSEADSAAARDQAQAAATATRDQQNGTLVSDALQRVSALASSAQPQDPSKLVLYVVLAVVGILGVVFIRIVWRKR